jgi:hypothetical protein
MASGSGPVTIAASPAISGSEARSETITGQPHAIASITGSPNPSYREGTTRHSAPE